MGPSQASMEGEAVERRFQSSFVKSIFFEIGVLGGAAKLNLTGHTVQDILEVHKYNAKGGCITIVEPSEAMNKISSVYRARLKGGPRVA